MSVLQYPQGVNPSDLQVWNNAAFDHGDSEDLERSWSPPKPLLVKKISDSLESVSSKENRSPLLENPSICAKSPRPIFKPLHPNRALENSESILNPKPGSLEKGEIRDEKKIDKEIEEIEMEINRLSSRLKALRMEKAEKCVKIVEKRGRVVTAKFMDPPKQSLKKVEESLSMSAKMKVQRRGLSLGPSEIFAGARRGGMSMGPSEIFSGVKSPAFGKQGMITPVQSIQSRRKSCFFKLQDIDEEKNQRGGSRLSLSPKSRKTMAKTLPPRQAITTVQSKKTVKKDESILGSVQPKKLFKDGEKSNKKPQKQGRVVASRYNQSSVVSSSIRKRSLPENDDKDDGKRCDKKRSLSIGKSQAEIIKNLGSEIRVKKKWEIPDEIVLHSGGASESEKSPGSGTSVVPDMLPRIRTVRCLKESPRDSGPAKRVAELIGKKTFFSNDEDVEPPVCQALSFADDNEALSSAEEDAA